MSTQWWVVASALKGIVEIRGPRHDPRILEMFRLAGHSDISTDETAWCAAFAGACLALSGYASTKSLMARSYLTFGDKLDTPRQGCIAVLWRETEQGTSGHVGFFSHEDADHIYLLGGNQSDSVSVAGFPKARLLGYRWPTERVPVATSRILPNIIGLGAADPDPDASQADDTQRGTRSTYDETTSGPDFLPLRPGTNPGLVPVVEELQARLVAQGYPVGALDGLFGLRTATAVFSFQQANGIPATGTVDAETWFQLQNGETMPLWQERRNEDARGLKADGSRTIALTDQGRLLALATAVLGTLGLTDAQFDVMGRIGASFGAAAGSVGAAAVGQPSSSVTGWVVPAELAGGGSLETLLPVLFGSQGGVWIALVAMAVMLWRNAQATTAQRIDEHRTGSNLRH